MLWHIGNTTVRTPYRLREALIAIKSSTLLGNLTGKVNEQALAKLLNDQEILDSPRIAQGKDASDLGRKWRSALTQLGFLTAKPTTEDQAIFDEAYSQVENLHGIDYELTPNGLRLINAEDILSQQECFLRSIATYQLPSILEKSLNIDSCNPLIFTIRVVKELNHITFDEFALYIQTSSPTSFADCIHNIKNLRDNKSIQISSLYENLAEKEDRVSSTISDYADLTFRYLAATGVFRRTGRKLVLSPTKIKLAEMLASSNIITNDSSYLQTLWLGAGLPTDDKTESYSILQQLVMDLHSKGKSIKILPESSPVADIHNQRLDIEDQLLKIEEAQFANAQKNKFDEISKWMEILPKRSSCKLSNGEKIKIPKSEGPAYFEWIIWRAFLAIDSLSNLPWEARRFQIDQDFFPTRHAPGGGPDMIFEFEESIIIVEVTLSTSTRQEAMEGAPVRGHVAKYIQSTTKDVYGLFIAIEIDSNTAHTFKHGDWYLKDDKKISLDIVPITLEDFKTFFLSGAARQNEMPSLLRQLLIECRAKANQDSPLWKSSISNIIKRISSADEEE